MIEFGDRKLIGLCGYKGSGKTYLAKQMLKQEFPVMRIAFAGPIKAMLYTLLRNAGLSYDQTHDAVHGNGKETPLDVLQGKTPRLAMQTLGTEWGRELIGANLWIDIVMMQARVALESGNRVVIDDVRFTSESYAIQQAGGVVIRVSNPAINRADAHISEQLPPYDETYENVVDV